MSGAVRSRRSGLQRQVLSCYAECLRAARRLPVASRVQAVLFVRGEFRVGAKAVEKLDIQRIEFMLRQARKKAKNYTMAGVSAFETTNVAAGTDGVEGLSSARTVAGLYKAEKSTHELK